MRFQVHGWIVIFLFAACSPEQGGAGGNAASASSNEAVSVRAASTTERAGEGSGEAGSPGHVLQTGSEFQVTCTTVVKGTLRPEGAADTYPLSFFQQVESTDRVLEMNGARVGKLLRRVRKAENRNMDPETRQTETQQLTRNGSLFRLECTDGKTRLFDHDSNSPVWNKDVVEALGRFPIPRLWPDPPLSKGRKWSYTGEELARRISLLDIDSGTIDLCLERLEPEPTTGLETAYIRGALRTRIDLGDGLMADFDARVEIDVPVVLDVPFMVKFEGRLTGRGDVPGDWGRKINLTIDGEGTLLQVCKPSEALLTVASKCGVASRPVAKSGQVALHGQGKDGAPRRPANLNADSKRSDSGDVRLFNRIKEPKESAFSLLIPSGWQVEGGILRIDPLAQGGAAQSIEAKLDFTVKKDAQGTVMIHWPPELTYKDARNMPARRMGGFPEGSNYMGMTVWPLQTPQSYLKNILLPQSHPRARNMRVVEERGLPKLARALKDASNAIAPGLGFTYDAACLLVTYDEGGVRYKELLITAIENWGALDAWKNKSTFYLRAPEKEFETWEPVFGIIQRSVILDANWAVGEIQGQIKRGEIAGKTYAEVQRIGREIADHHRKTNAEINNDMFLTLTDQEEYVNPFTNEIEIGSNQWDHLWTDEIGNVLYTNDDGFDPNTDPNLNLSGFRRARVK